MSVSGISDSECIEGSLFLTHQKAVERGASFHETLNMMTGERTDLLQRPISGVAYSIMRVPAATGSDAASDGDFVSCPTPDSLWRMDALRTQVAEDTPAVEEVLANCIEQAGIDPSRDFSMTVTYDEAGESQIHVGRDHPQWQAVENLFQDNSALRSDVLGLWNQQGVLADMRVVAGIVNENAAAGQEGITEAWLAHGHADLVAGRQNAATLRYQDGRLDFPS
ncbi:hypothetical protein [Solidesulfovibrio alcoholivorans]|uniref:hypothetical protein n=1 Tax=Solidesulfovibrio alcoholivorans TaxID=81406 RepID=UPI000497C306|nr:hypothetical protein [Solidesulfovibrio alcoholivorans]